MATASPDLESLGDQETEPVDYGPKFLDLPQDRIDQLRSLTIKLNLRDQWARQIEIIRCTMKRYFWLGLQHVWWDNDSSCFQVGQTGGSVVTENMNSETTAMQDFNIYKPNGKIFTSVFAQNPATVRAEPDQPKESDSIRAAKEVEKYLKVYDKYNPAQDAQITIGRLLWNDGRIIAITEPSDDGLSEKTRYVGVLESKVPIYETQKKLWPYCKVSTDHDILTMKEKHPEVADALVVGTKGTAPNDEIARMARIATAESIAQISHDTLAYLVTEDEWWIRPSAFNNFERDQREFWKELFPNGCKATFVGGTFCGADDVSLDDQIEVLHAEPGEGQARNSLGDPHVPVQMEFNDAMNLTAELLKYCIPSLWADIDETEFAAIKEQLAQYGQIRPFKRKQGEPMQDNFFPEPQIEAPVFLEAWIENLQGPLSQLVTLNQPAMFGANMEDQKTAKAYAQALNQSLGVLTIVWVPFQRFAASIRQQAAKIASQREDKIAVQIEGRNKQNDIVEVDPLVMRGNFSVTAVADQGFPESWTMKSQTIKGLMAAAPTNPILASTLMLPDNLVLQRDAIGVPELVIEGADSRDKQLQEWAEMQKGEGPEEDQQATQQKQQAAPQLAAQAGIDPAMLPPIQPVMKSSVPVDPDTEDHIAEALECFRILNSPEGLKVKAMKQVSGTAQLPGVPGMLIWQDLKLHMLEHISAGKAKGLVFPPPIGGPPPLPMPMPAKPGAGAGGAAPPPPLTQAPPSPGGPNNAPTV
jgi:hypothetical protein